MTCGEATIGLLHRYGITTVFGIPGVHTLDLCRGFGAGVTHVRARNELGAGFMAEGWARATGEPGVALVISGPGVTNAATALGQAWADSLPLLLISAEPATHTHGKGWGVLHEVTEQRKITEPLTAFSATAGCAAEVPGLLAEAFRVFSSGRPRPVHVSIPVDVQAEIVAGDWQPVASPVRPAPDPDRIEQAAALLRAASRPIVMVGGGATGAAGDLTAIVESLGAVVVSSSAGKGIVPDDHPLALSAATMRPEVHALIAEADAILAVGTELSETDSFVERLPIGGPLIRVDVDPAKLDDLYRAEIGIVADAAQAMASLRARLDGHAAHQRAGAEAKVKALRAAIAASLSQSERRHARLLGLLARVAPPGTIWSGDACQLVYTGAFAMPVREPRKWFYPAGYCALGNALPNAIGAKLARPGSPVAVLAGDGGFMFTMPELLTAADLGIALPVVIWDNGGYKQIRDDMDSQGVARVGVDGSNPDFVALARACGCHGVAPHDEDAFASAFLGALDADRPTVIVVREGAGWLR